MTLILIQVVVILLLVLFVFMEMTELAGAMLVLAMMSSGGIYMFDPASVYLGFGALALLAVIVIGLVVYRYMGRRPAPPPAADGGGPRTPPPPK